jgi:hypothetical protein
MSGRLLLIATYMCLFARFSNESSLALQKDLVRIAKKLKKNNVAVDVVS